MREVACIALLAALMVAGPATAQTGADDTPPAEDPPARVEVPDDSASRERATEKLSDLLFSEKIDRIDYQATTYEEGIAMIETTISDILDRGIPILGSPDTVAARGVEIIEALNASEARGLYATFQKDKQTLFVRNRADARAVGEIVGTTMSIIHDHYGTEEMSYRLNADNLLRRVRRDEQESTTLLELYRDHVRYVARLPREQQSKYLN
jgi:hypothetical protein